MLGGIYALLGIGLTLIFGIMRVVNFTHGELYSFGAYMMFMFVMLLHLNFFLSLVLDPMKPTTPFGARNSGLLVSRSVDHGATWQAPVTLIRTNSPHALNDKDSLTADPTANGYVYAVWDQLSVFPPTAEGAALLAQNDGVAIARQLLHSAVGNSSVCEPFQTAVQGRRFIL